MIEILDAKLPPGAQMSAATRTRCAAHIFNLVVGVSRIL
jgi:hypothetical protein